MAVRSYFNIYVTHVVDAIDCEDESNFCNLFFWGQKDRGMFTTLIHQMNTCSFSTFRQPTLSELKREKIVCVLINDSWCRATIKDYNLDRIGLLVVFCIDCGLTQSVPLGFIRVIPQDKPLIRSCQPLASKFLLADVVMEKGQDKKELVLLYLRKHLENKFVKAVILGGYEDYEGVRVYLNDQLLAKCLVENHLGLAAATYTVALNEPLPTQPYFSIASLSPPNVGGANSWKSTQLLPTLGGSQPIMNRTTASTQSHPNRVLSYTASTLAPGVDHIVQVTNVKNMTLVMQLKSPEEDQRLLAIDQQVSAYADLKLIRLADPVQGAPCIALSSRDKKFHRGLVARIDDNKFATIYFVDYGSTELISQEVLFEILPELVPIKLHAIRVSLAGAEALTGYDGISEALSKMVLNKTFKCRVRQSSPPQTVVLYDELGRSVKDVLFATYATLGPDANGASDAVKVSSPLPNHLASNPTPEPTYVRCNLKVNPVTVRAEERLFVTHVSKAGHFFGQFENRPHADLKALEKELFSFYGKYSNLQTNSDTPLLYADAKPHLGDYAVVKWSADGNIYRVKIAQEDVNNVVVDFIDYGNCVVIPRHEVWTPVIGLKLFCQPPFGIQCFVSGVSMTDEEWQTRLAEQSLLVKLCAGFNGVFNAILGESFMCSKTNSMKKMDSCLSPEAPAWVPVPEKKTENDFPPSVDVKATRRLFEDQANTLRSTVPAKVTKVTFTTGLHSDSRPPSSCSEASASLSNRQTEQDLDSISKSCGSTSSVTSDASRNQTNRLEKDFDRVDEKLSPKRNMPISQPVHRLYPAQPALEGATKNLEVVYVENPNSFYCQLAEAVAPLDAIMEKLATVYSDDSVPSITGVQKGIACVAKYTVDGAWYRGQVLNIEDSEVDILFVDYGNQQRTPTSLVKVIEEDFVVMPSQAYHCSLSGVPSKQHWSPEEKTRFEETVMGKRLVAIFSPHRDNETYPVRLREDYTGDPPIINELFGAPSLSEIPAPDKAFTCLSTGTTPVKVNVAWFYHIDRFFLSPVDLTSYQKELDELEEFYSPLSNNELVESSPSVGQPCVVKFREDGRYYRSQIVCIRDKMANVLFVDYGNEQLTPLEELKRIHPRFMKCPQLTWQCRLMDVKPAQIVAADRKQHIDACFLTGEVILAMFHTVSDGFFNVQLKIRQIGDAAQYLLKHQVVERDIVTPPEKEIVLAPQVLDYTPDKTLSISAIIPYVKSPVEFWIQLEPEAVDALMERIDELALKPEFINKKNLEPAVGKPCLAFFADDGRWYRATVESVDGDASKVYYIDYGNCCPVNNADLKELPEDLAKLPAMAFKCCLDGAGNFSNEIKEAFQMIALDLVATVKFVQTVENVLRVRLFTADGVDVAEKIGLPVGPIEMEAYVAFAISPNSFWIQRKQDENLIEDIQGKLCDLDGPNGESYKIHEPLVIGQTYAVIHPEYSTWYRAEVKSISNNTAEIQFIDYGDTHPVPVNDIRMLPANLKGIPPMAIHCGLNLKSQNHWSIDAVKYFISACPPEVVCRVVLGTKESNNIQLIDSMSTPTDDIIEVLTTRIQSSHTKHVEDVVDLMESIFISKKLCQSDEHPAIISSRKSVQLTSPGQLLSSNAAAVCISSPMAVWLHLDPKLDDVMIGSIQEYVTSPDFAKTVPIQPFVGCFCLALFTDDNSWYRARVETVYADSVMVKYVDYGNTCPVGFENLRPLPKTLVTQPALALECALDGAEPGSATLPSSIECQEVIFGRTLSVTFVEEAPNHIVVRLHDQQGNDLNEKLGLTAKLKQDINQIANDVPDQLESGIIPGAEEVRVSHINSDGNFWIQYKKDEQVIEQIRDNLRPLDAEPPANRDRVDVKVGELYAVMHPEYNRFYRARVNRIHNESIEVSFLDFGQTLFAQTANVRHCPALLKYIPPMATECTFHTPFNYNQYSEEIHKAFIEATEGVMCHVVFSDTQPTKGLQTVEALYAKGVNVTNLLASLQSSTACRSGNQNGLDNLSLFSSQRQRGL